MQSSVKRREHLGCVEAAGQSAHPDLPDLQISAQSHYGSSNCVAFINVCGVEDDYIRRRQVRSEASEFMRQLGYRVEIEQGRDVYDLEPIRPASTHDRIHMLQLFKQACGQNS